MKKKYFFKDHLIESKKIDNQAFYIVEKLKQKGFDAYIVGGSVRDLILKEIPKDFDISTSAKPEEIKKIFKNSILIGKRFRLAHVRFGKKIIEVSTFRSGDISTSKLLTSQNIWGNAQDDAMRRDFTINALFYDTKTEEIIDFVGGFKDAKKKILKTIGDPVIRFMQDPVRMIRLLKFKARFDFKIEKNTLKALKKCKQEIIKSSKARVLEELLRMLQSGSAEKFFYLLKEHEILDFLIPKLSKHLNKKKLVYELLKQADIYNHKHKFQTLRRSVLVSCLIFPMFKDHLKNKYITKKKHIHLGIVALEAKKITNSLLSYFFHIPKKMKTEIIHILTNQFRIEPFLQKKIKIPKDPLFDLSMKFFKLRCMHKKELFKIYNRWHEKIVNSHQKNRKIAS